MDAGGLAQMTFTNFNNNGTASFGSRGKGTHLRNITVPAGGLSAPGSDAQQVPTPRSARSALLAGLRTAPKSPNPPQSTPTTAPLHYGMEQSGYASNGQYMGFTHNNRPQQRLPTPPSVASPAIHVNDGEANEYDSDGYAQMVAHNMYLSQLQQQLAAAQKVQQLQQQLAQLQMQSAGYAATPPMSPGMAMNGVNAYNQAYYNPYQQYVQQTMQAGYAQQQSQLAQQYQLPAQVEISPPTPQGEEPPQNVLSMGNNRQGNRSRSPPKLNLQQRQQQQQQQQQPEQSGSGLAFRRGHRKTSSLSIVNNAGEVEEAPRTSKLSGFPSTPMTATFAPGHASGTHPIRQPRGPPSIEELKAKPTAKIEGSQNFAIRQRRRAVSKLVSAGIERRSARSTGSAAGTMTPVSEHEAFAFEETASVGSAASGRASRQSLREIDCNNTSADEGSVNNRSTARPSALRAPSLVFSAAAEKRKSALF